VIEIRRYEEVIQIRMSRQIDGKPCYWVAAYLVDGLLIDTGCSYTSGELLNYLQDQEVNVVVNTHHHEDHVGANALLKKRLGVEIHAHHAAVPLIKCPPALARYRETTWGSPEPSEVTALNGYIETRNFRFEVIETPGHCRGHVSLVELSKGWCFTGDLYIGKRLKIAGSENDMAAMISSMKRLLRLDTDRLILFTALRTVEQKGRAALETSIQWFETLAFNVKRMNSRGMSVPSMVDELFGGESVFDRITGGQFSSSHLVRLLLDAPIF
jgi:hydroxyacylglutathione hydrolase